jgi:SAM-dependent methyltransferase
VRLAAGSHPVTPEQYDAWYDTPRGRWIGELEWTAVRDALRLQPSDTVLDVGCGTGWFTRRAEAVTARVVGLDIDPASLELARHKGAGRAEYLTGDATCLPFAEAAFDKVMSIAALCFVSDWPSAIAEIARVCRDRFAIGLLNRHSVLYLRKGRHGGAGAYAGAHWHTKAELEALMRALQVTQWRISCGVFDASGSSAARLLERVMPETLSFGSFLLLAGQRGPGLVSTAR